MNQGQQLSPANSYSIAQADSDVALSWLAIAVLCGLTALGIVLGIGQALAIGFTAGSVAVGLLLYFRCPLMYVSFVWWLWLVVSLVRRVSDFTGGYTEPSPFLLAPFLVTAITGITFAQSIFKTLREGGFPFLLTFVGLFYALLIGMAQELGAVAIVKSLLGWATPPLMGFYLFVNWRDYPSYRNVIQRTLVWAVLVIGCYGIFQYLTAPEWDMFWLARSGFTSAGRPEPMGFRIWSTLNSPGPFGNIMKSSLLVLFSVRSSVLIPSLITGYLAFLLSLIRSAWGGWFVGVLVLLASMKAKHQMQIFVMIAVFGVAIFSLASIDSFSAIGDRVGSLTRLQTDGSANIRLRTFGLLIDDALASFVGKGIGDRHYDWGIFIFLFNLGWFGTVFYAGGLLMLVLRLCQGNEGRNDKFVAAARAVVLSTIIQLPFGSVVIDSSGMMLWVMLSMGIAAKKYYREQRLYALTHDS
ncbi:MAG: O-antigen ligase domain-containing protein [Cyanobacteria bacterium P01_D01_bin.1]